MRALLFVLSLVVACAAQAQELRPWTGGATPALELADLDGKTHKLADYRGQAVLVNFWATCLLDRDIRASRAWGARVLPATFIVGPDGAVRYSHFGALDWSREDIRAAILKLLP